MTVHREIIWHADPGELDLQREPLWQGLLSLQDGVLKGTHPGAQIYVSRYGKALAEFACGEAAPGVPMSVDSILAWFSASKPITAMAVAILYDRGHLDLDDEVRRYIPEFRNGKESCTIRHVLTHRGGFAGAADFSGGKSWAEIIAEICAYPAEYVPGASAGYHASGGWYILAEIVRAIDGRPIDQFVAEEIFRPLEMTESAMGITASEQERLGSRLARVALGATDRQPFATQDFVDRFNGSEEIERVNPSGGIRGPARELGRFYEMMLAGGRLDDYQLVDRRTVDLFTACHRWGMPDATLMGANLAWGLGFSLHGNADIDRGASRRVYAHSGMVSSVGFADPGVGLAMAIITTGLLDPMNNARRLRRVSQGAFEACITDSGAPQ